MLIVNIKELVGIEEAGLLLKRGSEMATTGRIKNAFLLIKGKKIADYGTMDSEACQKYLAENHRVYDGKLLPHCRCRKMRTNPQRRWRAKVKSYVNIS